jgi:hypothetical protein
MMTPLHSLLPDLASREVRCLYVQAPPGASLAGLPAGEYAFLELYCNDLPCDCRRVFIQVIERNQPGKVFASINFGWEREAFYRKRLPWDPNASRAIVRGSLDPLNEQSEYSEELLAIFKRQVLDEPYRLRLRRHWQLFREELSRRSKAT